MLAEETLAGLVDGAVVVKCAHAKVAVAVAKVHAHVHVHVHAHHWVETAKVHVELGRSARM